MRCLFPLYPPTKEGEKGVPFGGFFFIPQSRESLEKVLISLELLSIAATAAKLYSRGTPIFLFLCSQENLVFGIQVALYFKGSQQLSH